MALSTLMKKKKNTLINLLCLILSSTSQDGLHIKLEDEYCKRLFCFVDAIRALLVGGLERKNYTRSTGGSSGTKKSSETAWSLGIWPCRFIDLGSRSVVAASPSREFSNFLHRPRPQIVLFQTSYQETSPISQ